MRWGGKVQAGAAGLFGAVVLVHCLWILALAFRIVRVLGERARGGGPGLWSGLLEAVAVAAGVWFLLALLGLIALAVWFRVQRTRP